MNETLGMAIRRAKAAGPQAYLREREGPPSPPPAEPDRTAELVSLLKAAPTIQIVDTVKRAQGLICQHYNFKPSELLSIRKQKPLAKARAIAMYIVKVETSLSYPQIGRRFASKERPRGLDHTSVMAAVKRVERLITTEPGLTEEIETLRAKLREGGMNV